MTINVLLTGAGGNLSHFIHNALKYSSLQMKIVSCDYSSNAAGLYLADAGYLVPPAKESIYLERILEICRIENIHIIMVGGITEMRVLLQYKAIIQKQTGAFVVGSSLDALRVMEDKWLLVQALREKGFNYPESVLPNDGLKLDKFLADHSFPVIVKDRLGAGGSSGVAIAHNSKQLSYLINTIANPMVQEYLYPDDEEYTVGAFIGSDGRGQASIVMARQLGLGMTFKGKVLPDSPLGEYGERILEALACEGPANLQLRLTKRGPVVFEINPRFSSTTSARAYYGYNEPEMCIRHFVLKEKIKRPRITSGRFFRVVEDIYVKETDIAQVETENFVLRPLSEINK